MKRKSGNISRTLKIGKSKKIPKLFCLKEKLSLQKNSRKNFNKLGNVFIRRANTDGNMIL
jgi:hypothetical protein